MALLDLCDTDLSLFEGQVEATLGSPLDSEHLSLVGYDGIELEPTKPADVSLLGTYPQQQLNAEADLFKNFGQAVEIPAEHSGNRWLDINVDLLDLLAEQSPDYCQPSGCPGVPPQDSQLSALEVLQSLADETERELSDNGLFSVPGSPVESHVEPALLGLTAEQGTEIEGSAALMALLLNDDTLPVHGESAGHTQHPAMDIDVDDHLVLEASAMPVLSPVHPDDVESILSSGPCSPDSMAYRSVTPDGSEYQTSISSDEDDFWMPERTARRSTRAAPYTKTSHGASRETKLTDRKQRKKQQNRDAALRYRMKKKAESESTDTECNKLEKRNKDLRDKCDQMTREIKYLKDLMTEVHRARGLKFKLPSFK